MGIFNSLTTLQKSLVVSILSIVLFVLSAGVSYSAFSKSGIGGKPAGDLPGTTNNISEDPNEPKTEECPLNGAMHSKTAKQNWEQRRPLAVMIENHVEARPQSGLSNADVVYETVAEGGITRFMAVFLCHLSDTQVGPVRSARTYFLDWLSEYNALYAHVGGANTPGPADALGQIIKYKLLSLNQFGIGFPTYWRDYERLPNVATEHTMYSTTRKLWEAGTKREWGVANESGDRWDSSFVAWDFKDDPKEGERGAIGKVGVTFWNGSQDYRVTWEYDPTCNCYKRNQAASTPHKDKNSDAQLMVKNVVVQFEKESRANDGYENNVHMIYGTIGQGKALIFQDGKAIVGQWVKKSRTSRSQYLDESGKEIQFTRGPIWIQTVAVDSEVTY